MAATSFVVEAAPPGPWSVLGPPAPFALGPETAMAYCSNEPGFTGRLTASSSSTTAVTAITSPTVYGYISEVTGAWSCTTTYRYDAISWNTSSSTGTYVWGALINTTGSCNWAIGSDDYLKANSTTDCPDTDAEYAMSVDFDGQRTYQNDNVHDTIGDFGFVHSDCTTWYGNKVTNTSASFLTSATNNRPGANCSSIDLDGTNTTQSITYDATAPTGTISVNSGAQATSSTTVTLGLSASDTLSGVYQRRFSNDGSSWSPWEAYGTSKTWTLTSGDATKTVYVKYRDNNLNVSSVYSDTITLDTSLPTVDFSAPDEGATVIQNSTSYSVAWVANSTGSSIASRALQRQRGTIVTAGTCAGVTFTNDGSTSGGASPKSETGLLNGYCYRWQQTVTDAGGNVSATQTSGSLLVDTSNPTVDFITPNEGATSGQGTTAYTVSWTESGTGTTIASRSLQRQKSTVTTPGVCPTTGWANDGSASTSVSPKNETSLVNGQAYRWVQTLSDGATNGGSGTSGCVIIDTALPSAAFSTPANGLSFRNTTPIGVTWTEDGGGGTITARSLQMQSGNVATAGTCDGVSFSNDGSPSVSTSPVNFNLVTGKCYSWVQTLTKNGITMGATTSGLVLFDTAAPTATISSPDDGRALGGDYVVVGTAADALSYSEYELEYGVGASPSSWTSLVDNGPTMTAATLHTWPTGALQGVYTLRLTVRDLAGNTATDTSLVYAENSRRGEEGYRTRVPFDLGGGWRMAVGVANGELAVDRHLFEIPSFGPPQALSLSYTSAENGSAGLFGNGWVSNLTQYLTFENGFVVWHRSDGGLVPFGQVASVWTPPAGHFETISYDGTGHRYTITANDQSKLIFEDAGNGRLVEMQNRFGKALTLSWSGSSATITDASSRATAIVISSGQITSVTDSAGRQWQFAYTSGNLTTVTDPASKTTTLAYSGNDLTSITRSRSRVSGSPETITWSAAYTSGKVTSLTDPVDATASNTFSYSAGSTTANLLKTYTPTYNTWTYTLDHLGRVTRATDPLSFNTDYAYDADSNLLSLALPIDATTSQTISYTYDSRGNPLTQTTPLSSTESVVTLITYNSTNDLLIRSEANNDSALKLVTKYSYDGSGHVTSLSINCTTTGTTPPSDATTCTGAGTQDAATNLITSFTYTSNEQLQNETDPLGRVTRHAYDADGNEVTATSNYVSGGAATSGQNVTTAFAFNMSTTAGKAGLVTTVTDPLANETTYTYDLLGRQTSEVLPGDGSVLALTRSTTYDELGNVLTETESWTGTTRTATHVYDKANRETSATDPASVTTSTTYDAAGNSISSTANGVTTTRDYDGLGRVTAETVSTDATTHSYDGQGRETQTIDPEGVTTTRQYDLGGRQLREATIVVMSPLQELVTTYVYDLLGRQTSSTSREGVVTQTAYDRPGRVVSTVEASQETEHAYDRAGNETSATAPDGTVTTTTFDPLNRPTVVVGNDVASPTLPTEDVTTTTWYDALGRTLATRDDAGISARSIYNVRGLAKTTISNCTDSGTTPTTDPPACDGDGTHNATTNVVTTTSYDGSGASTTIVIAQGSADESTIETAYDFAGRQTATRDPRGTVSRTLYDSDGRVNSTILNCTESTSSPVPPTGNWWECDGSTINDGTWNVTTSRTYDSHGNVATEIAPNARKTTYVYDDADRLIERIDNDVAGSPVGNEDLSTYFGYDDGGRQTAVRTPSSSRTTFSVTRYFFDDQGHPTKQIGNCTDSGTTPPDDSHWTTCAGNGTKNSATNLITEYEYDTNGNRVAVIAADPAATTDTSLATVRTRYAFDPETRRLCGVLENATIELATPDPCATNPAGNATATQNVWTEYGYDDLGNMTSMTDGEGHVTAYEHDSAGRMTKLTDALGNSTTWTFDALGRRTAQSARGTGSQPTLVSWTYDAAARIASRTGDSVATSYAYDDNGNRLTAQSGSGPTITATYDRLNRPLSVSVSNDSGAATTYTYSLTSPSWTDPSGSYTATLDAFDRQVDLADPVNGSTHWASTLRADGQPSLVDAPNGNDTTFTYDAAGNMVNKETAAGSTRRVEYAWTRNRGGNLLTEDYTKATDAAIPAGFAYDGIGRLTAFTRDGATTLYGWQAVANRASTQYASDPAVTTSYNAANRPTSDSGGGSYSNDTEGRLTGRPAQVLEWDSLGRLTAVWNAAHTTRLAAFSYDPLDRLLVVDRGTTDQLRFRYVGMTTRVAQIVDHDASSVVRSVANDWSGARLLDWTGSGSNLRYYGTNGHHDVSWTATSAGTLDSTLRYDPWGNLTSSSGSSLPDFRFQGSWHDSVGSGLSWAVARWYAPTLGRFISEDSTFGEPEAPPTWHLYAYGSGEPVSRVDPDGRWWFKVPFNMTIGGIAATWYGGANTWRSLATMNRKINLYFGSPTTIVRQGTCIYIPREWLLPPLTAPLRKDDCVPPSGIVGPPIKLDPYYRQVIADAQRGSRGSGINAFNNWWAALFNFTRSDLIDLTRRLTGFRPFEPGPNDLAQHIRDTNDRAKEFIKSVPRPGWRPQTWYVDQGVPEILGSKAVSGTYVTVGQYIFINGAAPFPARHFKAHEYVHILEWEGRGNDYLNSYLWNFTMGAGGGASNPDEAPSYLWEAWSLYLPADEQPWEIWLRPGEIRPRPRFF